MVIGALLCGLLAGGMLAAAVPAEPEPPGRPSDPRHPVTAHVPLTVPKVGLEPVIAGPGKSVTVTGEGFDCNGSEPGTAGPLTITWPDGQIVNRITTAKEGGSFDGDFVAPDVVVRQTRTLTARCFWYPEAGATADLTLEPRAVTPSPSPWVWRACCSVSSRYSSSTATPFRSGAAGSG